MVEIYLDCADTRPMTEWLERVSGFTTNPSLLKAGHVTGYRDFAQAAIRAVKGKPLSLEVLSDNLDEMESQALEISSWAENVYVKIPVMNTRGEHTSKLVRKLSLAKVKVNVTAITTFDQIELFARCVSGPSILSIFSGRIADTGRDPCPFILKAQLVKHADTKILWASCREPYNIKQAESIGCDIITVSPQILSKIRFGQDLHELSLETVRQFAKDAEGIVL